MNDWSAGYVVDIDYVSGFYREQAPSHIDTACLVRNVVPPVQPGERFSYCELGCGLGETSIIVAASTPHADVWAFDFNPSHIDQARRVAQAAGIDNIHFQERSFEELALSDTSGLPVFDYITLHGVWSWVSVENRRHIVTFINRHLRPGGVVYITYNALPGWAPAVPLQRLLLDFARSDPGRSDQKVVNAAKFLSEVAQAGSGAVSSEMLENIQKQTNRDNLQYLAHEYLNEHWAPVFQKDVADDLARAKLNFAASANIIENFPKLSMNERQREIVESRPASLRETTSDYFVPRTFRRDIYVRGARSLAPHRHEAAMLRHRLTLAMPIERVTRHLKLPIGEATLNETFYEAAFRALSKDVLTVEQLRALPEVAGSVPISQEIIGLSVGTSQVLSVPYEPSAADVARARRFNLHRIENASLDSRTHLALACAASGTGFIVDFPDMMVYEAVCASGVDEPAPVAAAAAKILFDRGGRLVEDSVRVEDFASTLALLEGRVKPVLETKLPIWQRLGAI